MLLYFVGAVKLEVCLALFVIQDTDVGMSAEMIDS